MFHKITQHQIILKHIPWFSICYIRADGQIDSNFNIKSCRDVNAPISSSAYENKIFTNIYKFFLK